MTRKFMFLFAFSLIFTVPTIFAQQKTTNFLGTWKLDETKIKPNDRYSPKSMMINVSETDGKLRIVQKIPGFNHASVELYQVNEKTEITVPKESYAVGVRYRRVRFLQPNKMQLFTTFKSTDREDLQRATWIISEDGKTLTIKYPGPYSSAKLVFIKQ
jgi:HSP20 family molecular chaperone IbpA